MDVDLDEQLEAYQMQDPEYQRKKLDEALERYRAAGTDGAGQNGADPAQAAVTAAAAAGAGATAATLTTPAAV